MKTKFYQLNAKRNFIFTLFILLAFCSCQKESELSSKVSSSTINSIASDGTVTLQASILPPVTPQSFIPNGGTSISEFQITTSQHIYLYKGGFFANSPLIEYVLHGFPWLAIYGYMGDLNGDVFSNQGTTLQFEAHYLTVDSNTSGSIVKLGFNLLEYRTDDEVYHQFFLNKPVAAQDMCLVNNVPHISFQNPGNVVLSNGYKELADVKLSGDTDWTLNTLPIFLSAFNGNISKCKLILRSNGNKIAAKSDSIQLYAGLTTQTVINFQNGGFHHEAGKTEFLKFYAAVQNGSGLLVRTRLYPLDSFKWTDGLGAVIPGAKNIKFFKDDTGISYLFQ